MAVAASKYSELLDQFISILEFGQSFNQFQYYRDIQAFQENTLEGDQLRAFFYACDQDIEKAIGYFKKALGYNEPDFMCNYLIYLKRIGFIKQYIAETVKVNNQLSDNPKLLYQLATVCFLNGDFEGVIHTQKTLLKLGHRFATLVSNDINEFDIFQKNLALNNDQLKFLISCFVNIADKNRISIINIHYESFEECGEEFNLMTFRTESTDTNLLANSDLELAKEIAKNPEFIGKRLALSFEYAAYLDNKKDMDYVSKM